jgi:RNA polymerase sporulation-specific sigma factor
MNESNVYYSVNNPNYQNRSDEDLIALIKSGDKFALEFLIGKYKELVNMKIGKYYIIGAEKEDIMQEGLIGLFKAIKSYSPDKQNSFKTFANLCIERQLITAIKSSNRQKHIPINTAAYEEDEDTTLLDTFDSHQVEDPLDTITKKEYYQMLETAIDKSLSDFEKQVLGRYIQGESYVQIAQKLDTPVKSIDNAIQRIRKKATKNMEES